MNSLIVTLMVWVTGCALSEDCPVQAYEVQYFDSVELCEGPRDVWRGISTDHIGACVDRKIPTWEELPTWEKPDNE